MQTNLNIGERNWCSAVWSTEPYAYILSALLRPFPNEPVYQFTGTTSFYW